MELLFSPCVVTTSGEHRSRTKLQIQTTFASNYVTAVVVQLNRCKARCLYPVRLLALTTAVISGLGCRSRAGNFYQHGRRAKVSDATRVLRRFRENGHERPRGVRHDAGGTEPFTVTNARRTLYSPHRLLPFLSIDRLHLGRALTTRISVPFLQTVSVFLWSFGRACLGPDCHKNASIIHLRFRDSDSEWHRRVRTRYLYSHALCTFSAICSTHRPSEKTFFENTNNTVFPRPDRHHRDRSACEQTALAKRPAPPTLRSMLPSQHRLGVRTSLWLCRSASPGLS